MEFTELLEKRRSTREYTEERVPHEELVRILQAAQNAPSWKNSQTARVYAVESPEKLEAFRSEILPVFNQKSSAHALLLVTTFVKDVAGFTKGEADNELGNHWGAYDLGLHDAYLVLAAKDAGYDTLIMGLRDIGKIRQILEIPEEEEIVSVIALGKAAGEAGKRPRKDLSEVVNFF